MLSEILLGAAFELGTHKPSAFYRDWVSAVGTWLSGVILFYIQVARTS